MDRRSSADSTVIEVQVAPEFDGQEHLPDLSPTRLETVARTVLRREGQTGELTLVITDDEGIHQLNRDFLGWDHPTDVLAFGVQGESGPFVVSPEASDYLGDVIVSYPRAVAQAAQEGHSVEEELNLLVVHGILHLLGYDHATEEAKASMWSRQEEILKSVE